MRACPGWLKCWPSSASTPTTSTSPSRPGEEASSNDLMLELWPGELDDVDEEPGFREATSRSETLAARLLIGLANARDELLREADRLLDLAAASLNVEADDA